MSVTETWDGMTQDVVKSQISVFRRQEQTSWGSVTLGVQPFFPLCCVACVSLLVYPFIAKSGQCYVYFYKCTTIYPASSCKPTARHPTKLQVLLKLSQMGFRQFHWTVVYLDLNKFIPAGCLPCSRQ